MHRVLAVLLLASGLPACQTPMENPASSIGSAIIRSPSGAEMGSARLFQQGDSVTINVVLQAQEGGRVHAVHLHETGTCEAPGFASAGRHLNPSAMQHGLENPQGPHLGDLPNLTLSAEGNGTISATISGQFATTRDFIFDADGTAIVVHASADDNRTDPSGASGDRIACGVFEPG